jgi:hypothetical protein
MLATPIGKHWAKIPALRRTLLTSAFLALLVIFFLSQTYVGFRFQVKTRMSQDPVLHFLFKSNFFLHE